jgi:hypothetical protein
MDYVIKAILEILEVKKSLKRQPFVFDESPQYFDFIEFGGIWRQKEYIQI